MSDAAYQQARAALRLGVPVVFVRFGQRPGRVAVHINRQRLGTVSTEQEQELLELRRKLTEPYRYSIQIDGVRPRTVTFDADPSLSGAEVARQINEQIEGVHATYADGMVMLENTCEPVQQVHVTAALRRRFTEEASE